MKTERLFAIVIVLLGEGQVSASELARRFEVSVRTIYRDLDSLANAGIPIAAEAGRNGGIRIMDNFKVDNRYFSSSEIGSLLVAWQSFTATEPPMAAPYTMAKMKSLIPAAQSASIQRKLEQIIIDYTPWISSAYRLGFVNQVNTALEQQRRITIRYENRFDQHSERVIEPHRLLFKENSWYLLAYCIEREDFRFFKCSRMQSIAMMEETFDFRKIPDRTFEKPFSDKQEITVRLRIHRSIKALIADRFTDFTVIERQDEFLRIEIPFVADSYGYHFLLSLGAHCECLAPETVRHELVKHIRSLLKVYEP